MVELEKERERERESLEIGTGNPQNYFSRVNIQYGGSWESALFTGTWIRSRIPYLFNFLLVRLGLPRYLPHVPTLVYTYVTRRTYATQYTTLR